MLPAGAQVRLHQREIVAIDSTVAIEVGGSAARPPRREQLPAVISVDFVVAVEVAEAGAQGGCDVRASNLQGIDRVRDVHARQAAQQAVRDVRGAARVASSRDDAVVSVVAEFVVKVSEAVAVEAFRRRDVLAGERVVLVDVQHRVGQHLGRVGQVLLRHGLVDPGVAGHGPVPAARIDLVARSARPVERDLDHHAEERDAGPRVGQV